MLIFGEKIKEEFYANYPYLSKIYDTKSIHAYTGTAIISNRI